LQLITATDSTVLPATRLSKTYLKIFPHVSTDIGHHQAFRFIGENYGVRFVVSVFDMWSNISACVFHGGGCDVENILIES
jgi:hypothetical protein